MAKKKGVTEKYLDQLFSTYIRIRDAHDDGYITCCNCAKEFHWTEATNGHFVKRRHRALRWDERNCHAECGPCNQADLNLGYADFMIDKYGPNIFRILENQKNLITKITPVDRKIRAANYRKKITQLKKEKGL